MIGNLHHANPDYQHPFMATRDAKNIGIIIITTDRGLAGGLNANIFKQTLNLVKEWQDKGAGREFVGDGQQGHGVFPPPQPAHAGEHLGPGRQAACEGPDRYGQGHCSMHTRDGKIDRLFMVHAEFVNTMTQKPRVDQLLPVAPSDTANLQEHWDYIYEPSAEAILDGLLMRYIESQVYSRRGGERGVGNGRAHGRDEGRNRQRGQAHP